MIRVDGSLLLMCFSLNQCGCQFLTDSNGTPPPPPLPKYKLKKQAPPPPPAQRVVGVGPKPGSPPSVNP